LKEKLKNTTFLLMNNNLLFLLGSGISINAVMPSTAEITEVVLTAEGVKRETSLPRYRIRQEHNELMDYKYIPEIVELIKIIWTIIKIYYYNNNYYSQRFVNYEDIYYIINEIKLELNGEIESPIIESFVIDIRNQILPKLIRSNSEIEHDIAFKELIYETIEYIKSIVRSMLSKDFNKDLSYLNFLNSFNNDDRFKEINIFTLNHDLLIEEYFKNCNINFESGFEKVDEKGKRIWNPFLFEKRSGKKIKLYKLHGSINWYRYEKGGLGWFNEKICFTEIPDRDAFSLPSDNLLLVGSYNKLSEYTSGIFAFILGQFNYRLLKCNKLIIIGYGFHDSGINKQISNWVYTNKKNRVVLIDPNIEKIKNDKTLFAFHFEEWVKKGILKLIHNNIEYVSYDDILKELNCN